MDINNPRIVFPPSGGGPVAPWTSAQATGCADAAGPSCMSQYPRAWDARTPALIFAQDAIVFPPPPQNQGLGPARLLGSRRDSKRGTAGWVSTSKMLFDFILSSSGGRDSWLRAIAAGVMGKPLHIPWRRLPGCLGFPTGLSVQMLGSA